MWVFYLCLDNVELAFITYQFRFDNFFLKILKDAWYFNLNPCSHPNLSIFKPSLARNSPAFAAAPGGLSEYLALCSGLATGCG